MPDRYILLDRDGTIIEERHYLSDPAQVTLLPGAVEGLRAFRDAGFGLVVVTNQSGVARGYFDLNALAAIHDRLAQLLDAEGITLAGVYFCPHHAEDGCTCRKPLPGMALQASRDLSFNPADCIMIGDKAADLGLGKAINATTVLVRTGHGKDVSKEDAALADYDVPDLKAAAKAVLTP